MPPRIQDNFVAIRRILRTAEQLDGDELLLLIGKLQTMQESKAGLPAMANA